MPGGKHLQEMHFLVRRMERARGPEYPVETLATCSIFALAAVLRPREALPASSPAWHPCASSPRLPGLRHLHGPHRQETRRLGPSPTLLAPPPVAWKSGSTTHGSVPMSVSPHAIGLSAATRASLLPSSPASKRSPTALRTSLPPSDRRRPLRPPSSPLNLPYLLPPPLDLQPLLPRPLFHLSLLLHLSLAVLSPSPSALRLAVASLVPPLLIPFPPLVPRLVRLFRFMTLPVQGHLQVC